MRCAMEEPSREVEIVETEELLNIGQFKVQEDSEPGGCVRRMELNSSEEQLEGKNAQGKSFTKLIVFFVTLVLGIGCLAVLMKQPWSTNSSSTGRASVTSSSFRELERKTTQAQSDDYFLVFDAGSTGTRLELYRWRDKDLNKIGMTQKEPKVKDAPSLLTYSKNVSEASAMLLSMLVKAKAHIPTEAQSKTAVWLKATAGIRIVPIEQSMAIIEGVDKDLRANLGKGKMLPFSFHSARIASGTLEAAFESLTMNFLVNHGKITVENYVGSLGMGGASLQIAFKPTVPIRNSEFSFYHPLVGKRVSIFAKSYMRYGQDEARKRVIAKLYDRTLTDYSHPCFLTGTSEDMEFDMIAPNGSFTTHHSVVTGTGNPSECSRLVKELLNEHYECLMPPCGIMGAYQPRIDGKFVAYSAYFFLANGLGLIGWNEQKVISPQQVEDATRKLCAMPKDEAIAAHPKTPWKYLKNHCFNGWLVRHTLESFGFGPNDGNITYLHEYNGKEVSWTRGAVIYNTHLRNHCKADHAMGYADIPEDEENE